MPQKEPLIENSQYFKPLTGVRAIAAFMVFLLHFNPFYGGTFLNLIFEQFFTGVSIFFVLSGFLITYRYREHFRTDKKWFYGYVRNRVARIYPIYFILVTVAFLYIIGSALLNHQGSAGQIVKTNGLLYCLHVTFLQGYFDSIPSPIPQAWSLSAEELFYFTIPLGWLLMKRRFPFIAQAIVLVGVGFLLVEVGRHVDFYGFFTSKTFMLRLTYFGRAIQFFTGAWLAMWISKKPKTATTTTASHIPYRTYGGLALMAFCILALAYTWHLSLIYVNIGVDNLLMSVAVAIFFAGLITEKSLIASFLSTKVMDLLGKSSYVFYLIHLGLFQQLIEQYISHKRAVLFILLHVISIALYKFVESPLQKLIRNGSARKRAVPVLMPVSDIS